MDPLAELRKINREMLIVAGGEIPPAVADALALSRDQLTRAIRLLSPELGQARAAEELPVEKFKAQADRAASGFRDCLGEPEQDPPELNF